MVKNDWKLSFLVIFCICSEFLELEIGYYYLRYYTAESRPGGEHLQKISGIFLISQTSFQAHETEENYQKIVFTIII